MTTGKEESSLSNNAENQLQQPVIYGYLPEPSSDEIDLAVLFSRLVKEWKLFIGIAVGGTLLAGIIALSLPKVYEPSISISMPSVGDVAQLRSFNALLVSDDNKGVSYPSFIDEGKYSSIDKPVDDFFNLLLTNMRSEIIPSSPQTVFNEYYDLFRSEKVWTEYVQNERSLSKHSDKLDDNKGDMTDVFSAIIRTEIEEPTPKKRGAYVGNPKLVHAFIDVEKEMDGAELLNGYPDYINQKLIEKFQRDAVEILKSRRDELEKKLARLRGEYKLIRQFNIQKNEQENAEKIAQLKGQIAALRVKAKINRENALIKAKEAFVMAKSLNIKYPTKDESSALQRQKEHVENAAEMHSEIPVSPLYLQGTVYLETLIETLQNRDGDDQFDPEINNLVERIHLLETDPILMKLKNRQSDDPWIEGLPEIIAEIEFISRLSPKFTEVVGYSLEESAVVKGMAVKPKIKIIIMFGFIISIMSSLLIVIAYSTIKERKNIQAS